MGLLWDLFGGFVAVIGLVIGRIIGVVINRAIAFHYFSLILAIIGLIVAGAGLKRKGLVGAFVVGFGLGLASPVTALIDNLF
jgi:hypothetical protein